jgi:hypothetical protein
VVKQKNKQINGTKILKKETEEMLFGLILALVIQVLAFIQLIVIVRADRYITIMTSWKITKYSVVTNTIPALAIKLASRRPPCFGNVLLKNGDRRFNTICSRNFPSKLYSIKPIVARTISSSSITTTSSLVDSVVPTEYEKRYKLHGVTTTNNICGVTVHASKGNVVQQQQQQQQQSLDHTIQTDLPKKMGGKDLAPQPVELLLAALMGCTQATALFVSRQMYNQKTLTVSTNKSNLLLLDRLEMDIVAIRDERGSLHLPIIDNPPVPSKLQLITGTVRVYMKTKANNNNSIDQQMTTIPHDDLLMLKEQTELRCPVANMIISSGCQLDVKWIDGNLQSS